MTPESTLLHKGDCPVCGEAKAAGFYSDGHIYCFAECGYIAASGEKVAGVTPMVRVPATLLDPSQQVNPWAPNATRKISSATLSRMGSFTAGWHGQPVRVYPIHNQAGQLGAQKLRLPGKEFPVLKGPDYEDLGKSQFVFQHVYGDRFDRQLIVTEGEEDALAVAEVLTDKTAVVSLTAGIKNALANVKANFMWADRFKDVVFWFDAGDPEAQKAAAECAALFKIGKARVATTMGFMADGKTACKDASDVLMAGRPGDIRTIIYSAVSWRPAGIVNAKDNPEDVCAPKEGDHAFSFEWPWPEVTQMLGPILPGQVTYHVAGTGIGKSTAVATIAFHVIEQGGKVGYLSFEGTRGEIKKALIVVHSGKRVDIEPLPDADMVKLHEAAFGHGRIELFDPENAEWTLAALERYIRYLAKALDCQLIVIDPLSVMVALLAADVDERRALDSISINTSTAAKELGVHIQISHHLTRTQGIPHEEGAATSINELRGSGGMANNATFVIGHERNQQAEGDDWTLTQLRSLKNRPRSKTGPMVTLEYSLETGQLSRTSRKFPEPGKPSGKSEGKGFAPVSNDY